jgi:NADPH:quinone reductase
MITALTGPGAVEVREVAEPTPTDEQVVVDVEYAGVAFPDLLHTRGEYQLRPEVPFTPGWEVSGVVRADAQGFRAGDRVAAMPVVGGFAETVAVDAHLVFPLPENVAFDKAAALPLNYLTVHFALNRRARLNSDEIVLVQGAAGGIGSAACQMAAAQGARVIAVVSSVEKGETALQAGAHEVVLADGFRDEVKRITGGRGVDIVVDPVGGDRFTDSLRSLAPEGRLLVIGFTGGEIPTVRVNRLLLTNTSVMGVGSNEFWSRQPELPRQQWRDLFGMLEEGQLDPVIGAVFPLEEAADAIRTLDERRATGKVLVRVR